MLAGEFCHCCGQKAHVHRTLSAFWHDLLHGVLHFEGKIWRTLPLLGWKPGDLTLRYIEGERARFVSPVALFLFTVFLMFAVFSVAGPDIGASEFHNTRGELPPPSKKNAATCASCSSHRWNRGARDRANRSPRFRRKSSARSRGSGNWKNS